MTPDRALSSWTFDPGVVVLLALVAVLYARGRRRTIARGARSRPSPRPNEPLCFWSGWLLVAIALVSPLDEMSVALQSAHMGQHLLLGLVAPLLLVHGAPMRTLRAGLPAPLERGAVVWQRRLRPARAGRHPAAMALVVVGVHVGGFWLWHVPRLYDAAVAHAPLHALEHVTLLVGGLLLWTAAGRARWRVSSGLAILMLFVAGLGSGALAALLTLAPRPFYEAHATTTEPWHLSPLTDQQLAGALMWVPGGLVYAVAAAVLFVRWLDNGPERQSLRSGATTMLGEAM